MTDKEEDMAEYAKRYCKANKREMTKILMDSMFCFKIFNLIIYYLKLHRLRPLYVKFLPLRLGNKFLKIVLKARFLKHWLYALKHHLKGISFQVLSLQHKLVQY